MYDMVFITNHLDVVNGNASNVNDRAEESAMGKKQHKKYEY